MPEKPVYLTSQGYKKFEEELAHLKGEKREQIWERIRKAKEFTDTVDNAEYDDAKAEQAFVEGRIKDLEYQLANAEIIDDHPAVDYVRLGSKVTVTDASGDEEIYTIVGSAEADPRRGLISNESPVGRALLGKRIGDRVDVVAPGGSFDLTVVKLA
jgi:transcription elongation factor GreA